MKIEILGTGCPKCNKLAEVAEKAAQELNLEYELIKVTDIKDIMAYNVISTPGLVVDGNVKLTGKVPSLSEMKNILV